LLDGGQDTRDFGHAVNVCNMIEVSMSALCGGEGFHLGLVSSGRVCRPPQPGTAFGTQGLHAPGCGIRGRPSPCRRNRWSGGGQTIVRIWDSKKNELKGEFRGAGGQIRHLAFSPYGRRLATAGGSAETVVQTVKVVRGADEQIITPNQKVMGGKRFLIVIGANGKVET
jgi:hypothetical protein